MTQVLSAMGVFWWIWRRRERLSSLAPMEEIRTYRPRVTVCQKVVQGMSNGRG